MNLRKHIYIYILKGVSTIDLKGYTAINLYEKYYSYVVKMSVLLKLIGRGIIR
jgi:hypothetical protein